MDFRYLTLALLVGLTTPGSVLGEYTSATYTYDVLGRLIKADYGSHGSLAYAYDRAGNITQVVSTVAQPGATPDVPIKPSVSDGGSTDHVGVSWSAVAGATSYRIFRCTDSSTGSCGSPLGSPTSTVYGDSGAAAGAQYYYRLQACNSFGCSDYSLADSGWRQYLAPDSVLATHTLVGQVNVKWSAPGNVGSVAPIYEVYRAETEPGVKTQINTGVTNTLPYYSDTTVTTGKTYWYWVKACASAGLRCSAFSSNAETGLAVPAQPVNEGGNGSAGREFVPLVDNLSAAYAGNELIIPTLVETDNGPSFQFKVFTPDTTRTSNATFRYSTAAYTLPRPTCPSGTTVEDAGENWGFLLSGKHLVAGMSYRLDCSDGGQYDRSYVYVVDGSAIGMTPVVLSRVGMQLIGLNLTGDQNQSGSTEDLMMTFLDANVGTGTIELLDFMTGGVYSSNPSVWFTSW